MVNQWLYYLCACRFKHILPSITLLLFILNCSIIGIQLENVVNTNATFVSTIKIYFNCFFFQSNHSDLIIVTKRVIINYNLICITLYSLSLSFYLNVKTNLSNYRLRNKCTAHTIVYAI